MRKSQKLFIAEWVKEMDKKKLGIIIAVIFVAFMALFSVGNSETDVPLTTTEHELTIKQEHKQSTEAAVESSADASEALAAEPETEDKKGTTKTTRQSAGSYRVNLNDIPAFSGKAYAVVNNNVPSLSVADREGKYFEEYTPLDGLNRCGVAFACLGRETMPTEDRGAIGSVKPSG